MIVTAYEIKQIQGIAEELNLPKKLNTALGKLISGNDRFMELSKLDGSDEGDLLGDWSSERGYFFGTILRLKRGGVNSVLFEQLDSTQIKLDSIAVDADEKIAGTIKQYAFFCLNREKLVLTSGISRKALVTYLNWLISSDSLSAPIFTLDPLILEGPQVTLADIKEISISESFYYGKKSHQRLEREISQLKGDAIKELFRDAPELEAIRAEDILQAKIQLKIRSREISREENNKEILKAILKSTDDEDISIRTRQGGTIIAGNLIRKKQIDCEKSDRGFPVEEQVKQALMVFLSEVNHE